MKVQEHILVPAHPDRAAAVGVLEHPEHALHASEPSVPEGFCRDDVVRRIFRVLDAFSCFHVDIITNNRIKINDKCKIIAITPSRKCQKTPCGKSAKMV